ncbi:Uu.00g143950.m01.CDS01 [Anthostomella pinea]|uniref:Uu.00g143950.m01.CDS01 n=1 Tax=Anthostomella pinea TaxID=933095 RepID=A0AAI8VRF3_9PEZI|nr:Uu.00g143950.m01.CDS01 [Anthostomella pinea]
MDFQPFSRLAIELRLEIWDAYLDYEYGERRLVLLDENRRVKPTQHLRCSLLEVNRESRDHVLKTQDIVALPAQRVPKGTIYVNLRHDTFFLINDKHWTTFQNHQADARTFHQLVAERDTTVPISLELCAQVRKSMDVLVYCDDEILGSNGNFPEIFSLHEFLAETLRGLQTCVELYAERCHGKIPDIMGDACRLSFKDLVDKYYTETQVVES